MKCSKHIKQIEKEILRELEKRKINVDKLIYPEETIIMTRRRLVSEVNAEIIWNIQIIKKIFKKYGN